MVSNDFQDELAHANQRIARGNEERAAGADDRARIIAEEATRRGPGGSAAVAAELDVSRKTVSQAIARAKGAQSPRRGLPVDTLQRVLILERAELAALPARHWQLIEHLASGLRLVPTWVSDPGGCLAREVEASDLGSPADREAVSAVCRNWTRVQALAVWDACHQGLTDELPTCDERSR